MSSIFSLKRTLCALVAGAFALTADTTAAQTYPANAVRLVAPAAAGGATDIVARLLAVRLQEVMGQAFIVENRAGANGSIGAEFVAKSPTDGYTLMVTDLGTFTSGAAVYPNQQFDPLGDFAPITMLLASTYGLAITPSLPINSAKELLAYAKANSGKSNYAMLGNGSASHLAGIELGARAGVTVTFVPYKGGTPALTDVAGGRRRHSRLRCCQPTLLSTARCSITPRTTTTRSAAQWCMSPSKATCRLAFPACTLLERWRATG